MAIYILYEANYILYLPMPPQVRTSTITPQLALQE